MGAIVVLEWIGALLQLAILGAFLVAMGALVWDWLTDGPQRRRRARGGHDSYEPRVHQDPMDGLGGDGL